MEIHEYIVEPGEPVPPAIEQADLFAGTIAAQPVLILLPRFMVKMLDEDGKPSASDVFEAAVRAQGAQPMRDMSFLGGPVAGWAVSITATEVRITGPGIVGELYRGSLPTVEPKWLTAVAREQQRGRGIVVITGAAASTSEAALDMIEAGRASWVRATVDLTARAIPLPTGH
ncbi:hypothetical protein ACWELJ_21250 [Nocardia sp. NPDC004582]